MCEKYLWVPTWDNVTIILKKTLKTASDLDVDKD